MYQNRRIVVVTPAGRERYLRLLAPHVLTSPLVDEWHLWINTLDRTDLAFMTALSAMHAKVRMVRPPRQVPNGNHTIGQFFATATDSDTVYIRMDDDIVYCEPDFFARFLAQRCADREALMMYPMIVNNAACTFLLKRLGLLRIPLPVTPWCMDPVAWESHEFAAKLHRWFLDKAAQVAFDGLRFGSVTTSLARVSINCISWFGVDLAEGRGVFPDDVDEEEYASVTLPLLLGRCNRISGQALVAHFAFYTQRPGLEDTNLLQRYAALAPQVRLPDAELLQRARL